MSVVQKIVGMLSPAHREKFLRDELADLYQQMSELTNPECAHSCRVPRSCCSPEYCELAEDIAEEYWKIDLSQMRTEHPTLPFMGPKGCVVPPHLRPSCTLHTCAVNGLGYKPGDDIWNQRYTELRERIVTIENKLFAG